MILRPAQPTDVPACSRVMYEAFRSIAERHNFPPDFPSPELAGEMLEALLQAPGFDALVGEEQGKIVGSIFVSRRSSVGGISVITVDPQAQDRAVGRKLMQRAMNGLAELGHTRLQLVQAVYHNRSLALYAKLGFVATDMLSNMTGPPITARFSDHAVRPASGDDLEACNALCRQVHGFDRSLEVSHAIAAGTALVVEQGGRITGYTTGVGFSGHGVGLTNQDLMAMIASAEAFGGPGILIPTGNAELFRWCLDQGLRIVQQMILMDTRPAGSPRGAFWPAVLC